MTWTPISEAELIAVLDAAVVMLSPEQRRQFHLNAIPPARTMCKRSGADGLEPVFVIAKGQNNKVIFFDDVEDEFGVATVDEPVTQWKLFPDLGSAVVELNARAV